MAHPGSPMSSASPQFEPPPPLDIGPTKTATPIVLQVGQALRVHLPASPASGLGWELQHEPPPLLSIEADPGGDPLKLTRPGANSRFMSWRFRAQRTGRTLLEFRYGQIWDTDAKTGRTETFEIEIR